MSDRKTRTPRSLLVVALQDLNDAEQAAIDELVHFETDVSPKLALYIQRERERAEQQSRTLTGALAELGASPKGAPNIWLRANIDDARRDFDTIAKGPLRDVALVGALRKAKQSERVSYETAAGLATLIDMSELALALQGCRDEEATADDVLGGLLGQLLAEMGSKSVR